MNKFGLTGVLYVDAVRKGIGPSLMMRSGSDMLPEEASEISVGLTELTAWELHESLSRVIASGPLAKARNRSEAADLYMAQPRGYEKQTK